jgi:hypothetical protein
VLPGQFLVSTDGPPPSLAFLRDIQSTLHGQRPHHVPPPDVAELPANLLQAEMVSVRNDAKLPPLSPLYSGPYRVLERSLRYFKLQIGDRTDTVSSLRLKAAYLPASALPAQPPWRGRPPGATKPPPPKKVVFVERPVVISGRPKRSCRPPDRYIAA